MGRVVRSPAAFLAAAALAIGSPALVPVPSPAENPCAPYDIGNRTEGVSDRAEGAGPLRVFAIQYRQLVSYVETYGTFHQKMLCLMEAYVAPNLDPTKTNLVVFNEDIGLATLATGSRGTAARAFASTPAPGNTPALYNAARVPTGAAVAFGLVAAGYSRQLAAYRTMFPAQDPRKAVITAATDTFVRGFMATFSTIARQYGVYVVASNNQGDFRYSTKPGEVAAFADPDLAPAYATGDLQGVWVATGESAWNEALLWGPDDVPGRVPGCDPVTGDCASADPASPEYDPRTNLIFVNRKTPLTQIEKDFLALDEGDMSPENTGPVEIPGLPGFKFGFAISLPAFMYGNLLGEDPPVGDPCASPTTWMRCLHARGVNTVLQPEANPGPWAHYGADGGNWQALTWGASTLRAVIDPTVPGFKYLVCPHMVGNLVDLPFDGQSAIMKRGATGAGRHYVGAGTFIAGADSEWVVPYIGDHAEFVALAPWVLGDDPLLLPEANRARLQQRSDDLMAGSLSEHQNAYLETAIYADLDLPA